jgi:hypothetical protein
VPAAVDDEIHPVDGRILEQEDVESTRSAIVARRPVGVCER